MSLNIKSEKTTRLARELADITGETMTSAITTALEERLERIHKHRRGELAARLMEIGRATAPLLKGLPPSDKVGDLLFDEETGLPK